jgi:chemotaxis-related protein WspB
MLLIRCHAGADRYAVESGHVSEVLPQVNLQRPGGSPFWLAGLLIRRGTATPVMDLTRLTCGSPCPNRLSSRIIVLQTELDGVDRRFGLLAENVGLCEIRKEAEESVCRSAGPTALGSLRLDAQGVFQLLDPRLLACQDRRAILFPAAEETPE